MLAACTPTLVIGENVRWRVPVVLTAPHVGIVGNVGEMDVDVLTGKMESTAENVQKILQRSRELGTSLPPYQPRTTLPEKYIAKNYQSNYPQPKPDGAWVVKVMATLESENWHQKLSIYFSL